MNVRLGFCSPAEARRLRPRTDEDLSMNCLPRFPSDPSTGNLLFGHEMTSGQPKRNGTICRGTRTDPPPSKICTSKDRYGAGLSTLFMATGRKSTSALPEPPGRRWRTVFEGLLTRYHRLTFAVLDTKSIKSRCQGRAPDEAVSGPLVLSKGIDSFY